MKQKIFTLQEVAKIFRVNPRTIFRLIHGQNTRGIKLPAVKFGHSWRIPEKSLVVFHAKNGNVRASESFGKFTVPKPAPKNKKKK